MSLPRIRSNPRRQTHRAGEEADLRSRDDGGGTDGLTIPRHQTQHEKLAPLRREVHFLGELLGHVLIRQEGQPFFETEERIR